MNDDLQRLIAKVSFGACANWLAEMHAAHPAFMETCARCCRCPACSEEVRKIGHAIYCNNQRLHLRCAIALSR